MAVSFGAAVLARSAITVWRIPNALDELVRRRWSTTVSTCWCV